jgi:sugar transferase (PEP-CTERM system associated)
MIRLFRVFVPTSVLVLIVSEAILIFSSYIAASYIVFTQVDPEVFLLYDGGLSRIALVALILILGLYFNDLYADFRIRARILLGQQLCLTMGIAFMAQALLGYGQQSLILPKWLMIYGSGIALLALFGWRNLYSSVMLRAVRSERILFIGSSPVVFETARHLSQKPELGMSVLGYLDEACSASGEADPAAPVSAERLGCIEDLRKVVSEHRPDRIVVGMRERRERLPVGELLELRFAGIPTEEVAHMYETAFGKVCAREIRPSQLIFSTDLGPRPHQVQAQGLYSAVIAVIATAISLPVMGLVALLVRYSSPGPVLFRQTRIGMHDRPFTLYKFRSMRADAEAITGAVWAIKDDPRVTPMGRWLRLLRLDELPQLFNVLRGEMSIVGPRPERPEFVKTLEEQIPYYRQRHCVKPGITGWAQINYKYGNTIEDTITKLEYDLYYIKNMSLSLDAYIIFHTIKTMLLFRGAH